MPDQGREGGGGGERERALPERGREGEERERDCLSLIKGKCGGEKELSDQSERKCSLINQRERERLMLGQGRGGREICLFNGEIGRVA